MDERFIIAPHKRMDVVSGKILMACQAFENVYVALGEASNGRLRAVSDDRLAIPARIACSLIHARENNRGHARVKVR